jgi:hypothetical protein
MRPAGFQPPATNVCLPAAAPLSRPVAVPLAGPVARTAGADRGGHGRRAGPAVGPVGLPVRHPRRGVHRVGAEGSQVLPHLRSQLPPASQIGNQLIISLDDSVLALGQMHGRALRWLAST